MVYYLSLFAYTVLLQYVLRNIKGSEVLKMFITLLPLFLFGSLRINCGDYEIYEHYNNWVRSTSANIYEVIERMEPGYAYLNKLLPYRWIIIFCSLLSCLAYGVLFVKLIPREYRWFGFILFFLVGDKTFYFMFSSIRNSISISLLMLYLAYRISDGKQTQSLVKDLLILTVFTGVSYLFHASALMFFPIAFLATVDYKMNRVELCFWIIALVLLWVLPIEQIIENSSIDETVYFSRYDEYVEDSNEAGTLAKIGSTIFAILCLVYIRLHDKEGKHIACSRLMLVFIYSYMLGSLNMRVSLYFIAFSLVFLTYVFMNRKASIYSVLLLVFAIAFLFYSSFFAGSFASSTYSPFIQYQIAFPI